jgi:hypothetical protein
VCAAAATGPGAASGERDCGEVGGKGERQTWGAYYCDRTSQRVAPEQFADNGQRARRDARVAGSTPASRGSCVREVLREV